MLDLWEREIGHPYMRGALNMAQLTLACALGLEARNPALRLALGTRPRSATGTPARRAAVVRGDGAAGGNKGEVMQPAAFFREAGSGPGVVCVHSNASSSSQWRGLMDLLASRFHVLAADTYGAGKSPAWPRDRKVSLRDEVELLEPVFARAGERFSLVGHSYGGGIALVGAMAHRQRLRAMALYEPTLFAVVEQRIPVAERCRRDSRHGRRIGGGARGRRRGGRGAMLHRLLDGRRLLRPDAGAGTAATADSVGNIQGWKDALFDEPTRLDAFAGWIPRCC